MICADGYDAARRSVPRRDESIIARRDPAQEQGIPDPPSRNSSDTPPHESPGPLPGERWSSNHEHSRVSVESPLITNMYFLLRCSLSFEDPSIKMLRSILQVFFVLLGQVTLTAVPVGGAETGVPANSSSIVVLLGQVTLTAVPVGGAETGAPANSSSIVTIGRVAAAVALLGGAGAVICIIVVGLQVCKRCGSTDPIAICVVQRQQAQPILPAKPVDIISRKVPHQPPVEPTAYVVHCGGTSCSTDVGTFCGMCGALLGPDPVAYPFCTTCGAQRISLASTRVEDGDHMVC